MNDWLSIKVALVARAYSELNIMQSCEQMDKRHMKPSEVELSIVIAVYNSADCLPELLAKLSETLDKTHKDYEVILVNDASPDNSWEVLESLVPQYPRVSALCLMRNYGQAMATLCGLSHAKGDVVVTMDDDLQHRPDQLLKLLAALEGNTDIDCVFGVYRKKLHSGYRNFGSKIIRRLNTKASGLPHNVDYSSFRVMRRPVVDAILAHGTQNPAISSLIFAVTRKTMSIEVEHAERYAGSSNYTLAKQVRLALDNIANVSLLPLRAVTVVGVGTCLLSLLVIAIVLTRYFIGEITVPGWTTVIILVAFFSGAILLSVGIIGEYLVRVLREVRGAPRYVVREILIGSDFNNDSGITAKTFAGSDG